MAGDRVVIALVYGGLHFASFGSIGVDGFDLLGREIREPELKLKSGRGRIEMSAWRSRASVRV